MKNDESRSSNPKVTNGTRNGEIENTNKEKIDNPKDYSRREFIKKSTALGLGLSACRT